MPRERLISIDEAAEKIGKSRRTIFEWIERGLLHPHKVPRDRRTMVDLAELPEAMRTAPQRGRPRPAGDA